MSGHETIRIPATLNEADTPGTCVEAGLFALQVTDRSMEPELPRGCVVVIDPGEVPRDGDIVVAQTGSEAGVCIGRLRLDGDRAWLVTDVPPTGLPLPDGRAGVLGVAVQRVGTRRERRKRYR